MIRELFACATRKNRIVMLIICGLVSVALSLGICLGVLPRVGVSADNCYIIGFVAVCLVCLSCFFVFRKELADKPEKLFLCLTLLLTCYSSSAYSVNEVSWDEESHFQYMLDWATLNFETTVSGAEYYIFVRDDCLDMSAGNISYEITTEKADALDKKGLVSSTEFTEGGYIENGAPFTMLKNIGMMPAGLIYALLGLFGISFSTRFILARMIYALMYSFALYFGMKRLVRGKMLFGTIAMLPTMIFLASNYSYDFWVNALSMFGIALLLGELQRPNELISKKYAILMVVVLYLAFLPKAIYFPLVLLPLLLGRNKFSSRKAMIGFRIGLFAAAFLLLASFFLPFVMQGPGSGDHRGGSDVNSAGQVAFVLSHPFEYAKILGLFLVDYLSPLQADRFIDLYSYLGHSSYKLSMVTVLLMVFLAFTDRTEQKTRLDSWPARILLLAACVASIVLAASALYVSFTAVGSNTIAGCQPRYLLPVLYPTLLIISSFGIAWPKGMQARAARNGLVLAFMTAFNLFGLLRVYLCYFVTPF